MAIIIGTEMKKPKEKFRYAFLMAFLGLWMVVQIFPLIWLFLGGFKTENELISASFHILPKEWHFENFVEAFKTYDIGNNFLNTLFFCATIVCAQMITSALAAFSLGQIKPKCGPMIFLYIMGTMMFSGTTLMFPLYIMFSNLGMIGSKWTFVLSASTSAYTIILFKNFFEGIPRALLEAAEIDGASKLKTFLSIILPLSKPICAVCMMNAFIWVYNSFLYPLMLLPSEKDWTVMIRLYLVQKLNYAPQPIIYVMLTVAVLPIILIYLFVQKHIAEGTLSAGIKG